jgi:hypothetical protein
LASRPLGEVGGVSRNRLLVDKMIVWRTILGLMVAANSQRQSHNLLAVFQQPMPRARDQRKQIPRSALLRQESPPRFHKLRDVDGRLQFCGRFAKGWVPSSPLRRKNGSVLYASNYSLAAFRCSGNPCVCRKPYPSLSGNRIS